MKKIIKSILCGELFFALLLFSGVFKESLNLPIDISILFIALTFIAVVIKIASKKRIHKTILLPIISLTIIYSMFLISYIISLGEIYATEKILKFSFVTLPSIVFALILLDNKKALHRFFISIAMIAFVLSVFSLPSIFHRGSSLGFIGFNGGNYQGLALLNGIGLIIQVFYFLLEAHSKRLKMLSLLVASITAFVLFATGSRMPILAFIVTSVYILGNSFYFRRDIIFLRKGVKLLFLLSTLSIPLLCIMVNKGFFETIIYRFSVLFTEESGGDSSAGRIERYKSAYEMIKRSPFVGEGLGGFPLYYSGEDISDYPHNIILEIIAEMGLIGLVVCIIFFALSLFRTLNLYRSSYKFIPTLGMVTVGVFIYYLSFAMVSGDINSNRILYVFMGIMCMFPTIFEVEDYKKNNLFATRKEIL
ncbi:O-antigen polymerase [Sporosarcina sp. NCCP-2222]|uniref:O-antigen ligase family protein n=1 Tax=Sporosarcina sp. NCCP-2222 TaxID=2935073 RepID=UPI00207D7A9E|nr:O-antigen ligase family protein [Sporosarcina sp. NCCP-2222]GKV57403.1 O-antigen polymerase [Sporosarcina sp. NCCP-2222]